MSIAIADCETGVVEEREPTAEEAAAIAELQTAAAAIAASDAAASSTADRIRARLEARLANLEALADFASLTAAQRDANRDQAIQLLARALAGVVRLELRELQSAGPA